MTNSLTLKNLEQTILLGKKLGSNLIGGEVLELISDLGGGKTTLTKSIVLGAGSTDLVTSPSFTICNTYKAVKFNIYHFDFYRLDEPGIIRAQLEELLGDKQSVLIVEWGMTIESSLPEDRLIIKIIPVSEQSRKLEISYPDRLSYVLKGLL